MKRLLEDELQWFVVSLNSGRKTIDKLVKLAASKNDCKKLLLYLCIVAFTVG